jgi:hypothetical protein
MEVASCIRVLMCLFLYIPAFVFGPSGRDRALVSAVACCSAVLGSRSIYS